MFEQVVDFIKRSLSHLPGNKVMLNRLLRFDCLYDITLDRNDCYLEFIAEGELNNIYFTVAC